MLRGEHAWCQLWSEPEAGSDLAAVRTRAVRDGDHWVLDGQKVWSSRAHYSEYGLLVARTDPDVPKHRGLTCFLLDMSLPGIDIRPIKQANGAAHFNEVFLTAARVAHSDVLGEVGGGFQVILATLGGERSHSGAVQGTGTTFEDLLDLARRQGRTTALVDRQALVSAYIRSAVIRYLSYRIRSAVGQGHEPGPESSIMKLAFSQHASATGNLMMALVGAGGMLSDRSAPDEGRWPNEFIEQIAQRIGGGTDEIQRNTIGERVLGLPPEPRLDKLLTFRQLSAGKG
jgi:alkylation response protein AidB-like acyl-CoA dehydrogenase